MAERLKDREAGGEGAKTPREYPDNPKPLVVSAYYLARCIAVFSLPDYSHATVARLIFDGQVPARTVKSWRLGTRYMPTWAIELLESKFKAGSDAIKQIARGRGRRAGLRNQPHEIRQN